MRKSAFVLSAAVAALAVAVVPSGAFADDSTKFTIGGGNDFFTPSKERNWGYESKDDSGPSPSTTNQSADKGGDAGGDKGGNKAGDKGGNKAGDKGGGKDGDNGGKKSGVKIKTGLSHEHDGTVTKPIGGTTRDGSSKGGWWAQMTGGGKWQATAGTEYDTGNGDWKGGITGGGSFGGAIGGGAQTSTWGGDWFNLQGRLKGELYAEIKGQLEAAIMNDGEFCGGALEGEVGAAIGARGSLEGNSTLFGIPVTVGVEGEALLGAKAKGGLRVGYDKKSGKWIIKHGASVAWGVGAGYNVVVGVDAAKLCNTLGLSDLWQKFDAKMKAKGDDPFDSDPKGGKGKGKKGGYKGLKTFKLVN